MLESACDRHFEDCLVQQHNTEPTEDTAKQREAQGRQAKHRMMEEANFVRKELQGGVRPLDKGLFMGAKGMKALFAERN